MDILIETEQYRTLKGALTMMFALYKFTGPTPIILSMIY